MLKETKGNFPPLPQAKGTDENPPVIGVTHEEDDPQGSPAIPRVLPILPMRSIVIFPGTVVPLTVGRPSPRKMLEESLPQGEIIGLFTQRKSDDESPSPDDLFPVGVAGMVLKLLRQTDESVTIVVQALQRIHLDKPVQTQPYLTAEVTPIESSPIPKDDKEWQAGI